MKQKNSIELEILKSEWQKDNQKFQDEKYSHNIIVFKHKSWFIQNKVAIEGSLCIITALLLIFMLSVQKEDFSIERNLIIYISGFIVAIYTFVKGIFTLMFFNKKRKLDIAVSKFALINLKNKLYFVYEYMFRLWILIPLIIIILPFVLVKYIRTPEDTLAIYCLSVGILYFISLLIFSRILLQKRRKILSEIKKIKGNK